MALVRVSETITITSALGLEAFAQGSTPVAADYNANWADSQEPCVAMMLAGVVGVCVCTSDGLDVQIPADTNVFCRAVMIDQDGSAIAVPDDDETYIWACSDKLYRLTSSNTPPDGFDRTTACLIVLAVASSGTVNLDHSVQHKARTVDSAARTVVEGAATIGLSSVLVAGRLAFSGALRVGAVSAVLSGNRSIAAGDPCAQFLDANGADREVSLWALPVQGDVAIVKHVGLTHQLLVKSFGGSTLATLAAGESTELIYDGAAWQTV